MNTKNTFYKTIRASIIIIALIFSSYSFAGSRDREHNSGWFHNNSRGHENGRGHDDDHEGYHGRGHENHKGNGFGHEGNGSDSVPIDGGLSILLVGAAAFGVKKLRDQK